MPFFVTAFVLLLLNGQGLMTLKVEAKSNVCNKLAKLGIFYFVNCSFY